MVQLLHLQHRSQGYWDSIPCDRIHFLLDRREDPNIRLYLNAYGASGLVWAKLGDLEKAKESTSRIKEIDGKEFGGATVVFDVLTQPPEEDE